jgi:zinc transport system ATP-binding protein
MPMSSAPAQAPAVPVPIIALTSAAFGYADGTVVKDITLTIEPGEVVALLGPNGSGKTTLVKGLLGLNDQLGGQVSLFGMPREQFRDHSRIGYVPQRHTLSASVRATVEEIVAVGRLPHHRWWRPVRRSARDAGVIGLALEVVGLSDRADADVSTLSGGQQRRVLIARGLAAQPDVLIMDEPTAGVDAANQEVLADVLARLAARGTTMLIVTHELEALTNIVTRILVVRGGSLAFDGTPAEFASRRSELASDHDGHHHPDELAVEPSRLPGAPTAGPLDPRGGEHHG